MIDKLKEELSTKDLQLLQGKRGNYQGKKSLLKY